PDALRAAGDDRDAAVEIDAIGHDVPATLFFRAGPSQPFRLRSTSRPAGEACSRLGTPGLAVQEWDRNGSRSHSPAELVAARAVVIDLVLSCSMTAKKAFSFCTGTRRSAGGNRRGRVICGPESWKASDCFSTCAPTISVNSVATAAPLSFNRKGLTSRKWKKHTNAIMAVSSTYAYATGALQLSAKAQKCASSLKSKTASSPDSAITRLRPKCARPERTRDRNAQMLTHVVITIATASNGHK